MKNMLTILFLYFCVGAADITNNIQSTIIGNYDTSYYYGKILFKGYSSAPASSLNPAYFYNTTKGIGINPSQCGANYCWNGSIRFRGKGFIFAYDSSDGDMWVNPNSGIADSFNININHSSTDPWPYIRVRAIDTMGPEIHITNPVSGTILYAGMQYEIQPEVYDNSRLVKKYEIFDSIPGTSITKVFSDSSIYYPYFKAFDTVGHYIDTNTVLFYKRSPIVRIAPNTPTSQYRILVKVTDCDTNVSVYVAGPYKIIDPKPALSAPINSAANQPTTINFTWNSIEGASSYTLQISTTSNFSSNVDEHSEITETTHVVYAFSNNATYYWRVKSNLDIWSEIRQFTTIVAAPAKPSLTTPSNNAIDQSIAPTMVWTATGATTCTLQVSLNANMSSATSYPTTAFSKAISGLANSTKYYWRVNAVNVGGTSPWSDIYNFITIVINPTVPTLTGPANGAVDQLLTPNLTWTKPSEAASCSVQVSLNSGFIPISSANKTTGASYIPPELQKNTTYYWRVCAINAAGISAWSSPWSFRTTFDAPTISNLQITPNLHSGSQATISWTASATNNDLTTQNISWSIDGSNYTTLSSTTYTGSYEWSILQNFASNTCRIRVQVIDGSGKSATITSNPFSVTDTIPPTTPIITLPGDVCYTGRPFIITWTATDNIGITARKITLNDGSTVDSGSYTAGTFTWNVPQKLMTSKFGIRVYDAAGNSSYAESGSFTVRDTIKPVLTVNSIDTNVSVGSKHPLTWTCSDNLGTVSVAIYLVNGTTTRLDSITGTSYEWTAPIAGRYHFLLRAYDGSGNVTESTSKEFTTYLTTEIRVYARAIPKQLELQLVKGMAILGVDKSEMTTFRVLDTKGRVLVNYKTSEAGYHTVSMDQTVSGRYIAILSRAGKQVLRPAILF